MSKEENKTKRGPTYAAKYIRCYGKDSSLILVFRTPDGRERMKFFNLGKERDHDALREMVSTLKGDGADLLNDTGVINIEKGCDVSITLSMKDGRPTDWVQFVSLPREDSYIPADMAEGLS